MEFQFVCITQPVESQKVRHLYGFTVVDLYMEAPVSWFIMFIKFCYLFILSNAVC